MPIKFHCPHCRASIKAPETHLGATLPCPRCGQPVVVAAESAEEPPPVVKPSTQEPSVEEVPQIVTKPPKGKPASPPPAPPAPASAPPVAAAAPPVAAAPPTVDPPEEPVETNAFEPPQAVVTNVRDVKLENVRIVDVRLSFGTVFRFAVQFFLANLLLSMALGGVMFLLSLLLTAIGLSLLGGGAP
ncbi:hypothetical protein [Aeoliella mucimassa]|uniref:Uncharacterized protein n=1 Tax=Aeoliella mucimassa TaxID=2527972 RepID=A0A518ANU5_9BACT|nr:hypothetical protein [Aeoliella mucimassa]QDU56390.1 hypothetical protein Pan181_25990 [Aeoliella mucimassa]